MSLKSFYLALITALIWGIVPLLEKAGLRHAAPLGGLFARSLGVAGGLIVVALFFPGIKEFSAIPLKSIILLSLGGLLASFVGQLLFYKALKEGEVSTVVPLVASYPLVTFILGVVIFQEGFSLIRLLGVALVIAGIMLLR